MADTKISDLTALTGANVADDDEFVIVDTSAAQSKRITKTELAVALGTNDTLADVLGKGNTTGGTDISVSSGDDITFADNSKAIFGTGSDLQIYHNASNSYIEDTGTGNLNLRTNGTSVRIDSTGSAQLAATFVPTGAQTFYYNNSQKLATTTSGIDVTGTVTADGLTVDTNTLYVDSANNRVGIGTVSPGSNLHVSSSGDTIARVTSGDGFGAFLDLGDASDPDGGRIVYDSGSNLTFNTASTERLRIDSSGGVHVGGTSEAGTSQVSLNPSGYIKARKNDVSGIFDRITSDGDIVQFRKDGTTVGIIGGHTSSVVGLSVRGNASYGGIGLPNDRNTLWPVGATGNPADNFMDMGSSSVRWKDLYLSGTIQIEKGTGNVVVGKQALNSNTGSQNTAAGYQALYTNTAGDNMAAFGYQALYSSNTTGSVNNNAFGFGSQYSTSTGTSNTSMGHISLYSNTTGSFSVALGVAALYSNTTASNNTAVGYQAGYSNTTGIGLVAVGALALNSNTTGVGNTAVGTQHTGFAAATLQSNTTGSYNTGIGTGALYANTTASYSVAVGYQAAYSQTAAGINTCVGFQAGYSYSSGAGNGLNTMIGNQAGYNNTGYQNTFIGTNAGHSVTSGSKNSILGMYNGNQNGLDIRTSNNNIVLSDGDGNPRSYYTNRWHFFSDAPSTNAMLLANTSSTTPYILNMAFTGATPNNTTSEFLSCGDPSFFRLFIYSNGNVVNRNNSYGAISDEKLKENIVDSGSQWDDIKALRVRKYSMKEQASAVPTQLGVIAQEVEAAGMGGLVFESPDKQNEGEIVKQVNYSVLYMKAVKALQEAMERIETLETENVAIKARLDALEAV